MLEQLRNTILIGDVRDQLQRIPDDSVHAVVTSPPYWALRNYRVPGQIGLESTPEEYVANMVEVMSEVRRVLRPDGVLFLNLGDTYYTHGKSTGALRPDRLGRRASLDGPNRAGRFTKSAKSICGLPWRVALAMQDSGWFLRSDCIWEKPNAMPESVNDRPSKSHEYVFVMVKSRRYFWDKFAVSEPVTGNAHSRGNGVTPKSKSPGANSRIRIDRNFESEKKAPKHRNNESFSAAVTGLVQTRNLRTVWKIPTHSFRGSHFATFPPRLAETCIKAGSSERGCCPDCGKPWVRIIEKERVPTRPGNRSKIFANASESASGRQDAKVIGNRDPLRHCTVIRVVCWKPGCDCKHHEPAPCVILDPFLGSGTTAMMAEHLGRDWIGIELNPEYAAMAMERIGRGYVPPRQVKSTKRRTPSNLQKKLEF